MVGSCSGDVNVLEALVAFKSEFKLEWPFAAVFESRGLQCLVLATVCRRQAIQATTMMMLTVGEGMQALSLSIYAILATCRGLYAVAAIVV